MTVARVGSAEPLVARAECERAITALVDAANVTSRVRRVLVVPGGSAACKKSPRRCGCHRER